MLTIFGATLSVLAFFFIPETNPNVLLQRRATKKRKETGDKRWRAKKSLTETPRQLLLNSLIRPMKVPLQLLYLTAAPHFQSNCIILGNVRPKFLLTLAPLESFSATFISFLRRILVFDR